jgi:microcystin degradation protein MlrC
MAPRIAVGAIFTESNHLVGRATALADFERTELRRGDALLSAVDGVLGGCLARLRERGATVVPLLFASAVPGGPLTDACYRALKSELLDRLRDAGPVDGVLMPQHGAAAVEGLGSLDDDLIAAVRDLVGGATPIVATLDCHAHVTAGMVAAADALVAWETYPHRDTHTTGGRGAALLMDTVERRARPAMAMGKAPVIVGGFMGGTDQGPFADFMRATRSLEDGRAVLSSSAFLVQPQLDLADMGGGAVVVADGDRALAERHADRLARLYWDLRFQLEPRLWAPDDAIADGSRIDGTVLLLETSDCAGGGATGDSAASIRALLAADAEGIAMVVDPEAAALCHRHRVGHEVHLALGHNVDPRWGQPLPVRATILGLGDGGFVYSGGIWGGQAADMGPTARLRIGKVDVLVATHATYDWADEQYRSMGMDASRAKFVVVKNPMNYRVGYAGRYAAAYVLDTPGPTPASMRHVPYQRLQRPYFPVDAHIPDFRPAILRGRHG